jgi:putative membrane protein
MPSGFLGTRGDLLMDVVVVAIVLTPLLFLWAVRLARRGEYVRHRNLQTALLGTLLIAVVLFEVDIRLHGGTKAFMAESPYLGSPLLAWLLRVHVLVAVLSFGLWCFLVVSAWRARMDRTPSLFTPKHRRRGYWVFAGTVFTAVSGVWLYWLGFVA